LKSEKFLSLDNSSSFLCVCVYSSAIQKQLACILGRQQIFFELDEEADNADLMEHMRNTQLNAHFLNLAREVMEQTVTGASI
jgi:hypothetical protein